MPEEKEPAKNPLIIKLSEEVAANLMNEQYCVEDLAENIGMSRSQLHRKLQETTGQSVSQFIREYRLQKAMDILINKDLTASEVAYQVGFGSATYFSKSFNDFYGYPPGEAKKRVLDTTTGIVVSSARTSMFNNKVLLSSVLILIVVVGYLFYQLFNNNISQFVEPNEGDKSIAILPFKNQSSNADNQYFADGVMTAISNKLSVVGQLKVTSSTSVEQYRTTTKTLPEIAMELGVSYILQGSAQKYGEQIRISIQLISAKTDEQIWYNDYTRTFSDVLLLQTEIAENVAGELEAMLTSDEQRELRKSPTEFPGAYNFYMLANFQYNKSTEEGLNKAIPLYEKAIDIDSNFGDAYAGLASVWVLGGSVWGIFSEETAFSKSKPLLFKALELDPTNDFAHSFLAFVYFYFEWDFESARKHFKDGKYLQGSDFLIKIGDVQTALKISELALTLEPDVGVNYMFVAEMHYFLYNYNQTETILDDACDLFDDFWTLRESAKLYYYLGEFDKSKHSLKKLKENYPDRPPIIFWLDAVHAYHDGLENQASINQLNNMYDNNLSGSPAWFLAMYYAELEDEKATFEWLEKSYERHEVEMTWLKMEPLLDPYKENSRYLDLMGRIGFPE